VGGGRVDCAEDRLRTADPAGLGQAGRGRLRGVGTADAQRIKELEREVKELRRANEILKVASAFFAQAELDRRLK
jgi:transposase-like protein